MAHTYFLFLFSLALFTTYSLQATAVNYGAHIFLISFLPGTFYNLQYTSNSCKLWRAHISYFFSPWHFLRLTVYKQLRAGHGLHNFCFLLPTCANTRHIYDTQKSRGSTPIVVCTCSTTFQVHRVCASIFAHHQANFCWSH